MKKYLYLICLLVVAYLLPSCKTYTAVSVSNIEPYSVQQKSPKMDFLGFKNLSRYNELMVNFGEDLQKTMFIVAKDTKTKISFNKDVVKAYRLIGYENKLLTEEEFNDLVDFVKEIKFDRLGVFEFSREKDGKKEYNSIYSNRKRIAP